MDRYMLARPYAKAAFAFAHEQNCLEQWSYALKMATDIANEPSLLRSRSLQLISQKQLLAWILDILDNTTNPNFQHFLMILADYKKLGLLPIIRKIFERFRAEQECFREAEVTSAFPLTDDQEKQLASALSKRFNLQIKLHCRVDSTLISGVRIRFGNIIIERSGKNFVEQFDRFLKGTRYASFALRN